MSPKSLKNSLDKTGIAFLTLLNDKNETFFVGNVDKAVYKDGVLYLSWKVPDATHIFPFSKAVVHNDRIIFHGEQIQPFRADMGVKRFELEL